MKVSIQVLGSLGDVMPYISTAKALQARGADVSIFAPRDYRTLISEAGIAVDPPADFSLAGWMNEAARRGTLAGPLSLFRDWNDMISPHVDDVMTRCLEAATGADIVVANLICAPARVAAEAQGTAFMLTAQQPVLSPTRDHPCAMVWRPWAGGSLNAASYGVVGVAQRIIGRSLGRYRRRLGLRRQPPLSDTRTHMGRPLTKVTSISPVLIDKPPADWSSLDRLTAYPSLKAKNGLAIPSVVEHYLERGTTPVYVGLGSLGPAHGDAIADAALAALDRLGLRGIFPEDRPDGRIAAAGHLISGYVPHEQLFPRCAAVIHHGGAGTVDTALRAGVPQIVQPHMLDQFWFAARLEKLGLSGPALHSRQPGVDEIVRLLNKSLTPPAIRSARMAAAASIERDGADELAALILAAAEEFRTRA